MTQHTLPSAPEAERFLQAFAAHWGLDADALRKRLISKVKPEIGGDVAAALTPVALEFRDAVLRPILRDLYDWLRAQLTFRLGALCSAYRDDAVGRTLELLVGRYWRASWATPEGRDHLRRYARMTAARIALRMARSDQAREARLGGAELAAAPDPETVAIRQAEERQRQKLASMVRDLRWLMAEGLTPAEANAIVRSVGPAPTAGLDPRGLARHHKASQRGKRRLQSLLPRLGDSERRLHARSSVHCSCTVEHLGLRGRFQVVDCSAGGLGLESAEDDAALELGADCTVRILSGSTVIVRGARCVRIDQEDGSVRIGLQFHFPHPLPPLPLRPQGPNEVGGPRW